jgi:hypothetical protein
MATSIETCANCGEQIGKLETPFLWDESIVCGRCHQKLSLQFPSPEPISSSLASMSSSISKNSCPGCGSADTANVEVVYQLQTSKSSGSAIAVIGDSIGVAGFGGASSSLFASNIAPPAKKGFTLGNVLLLASVVGGIIVLFIGLALANSAHRDDRENSGGVLFLGGMLLICG